MQFVLTVVRATDVAAKDANGTSDPYAIVHLIEDSPRAPLLHKRKSEIKYVTLNPVWDFRAYDFTDFDYQKYSGVHIQLWDYDRITKDDFLGECVISMTAIRAVNGQEIEFTEQLLSRPGKNDRVQGTVTVRTLHWDPRQTPTRRKDLGSTRRNSIRALHASASLTNVLATPPQQSPPRSPSRDDLTSSGGGADGSSGGITPPPSLLRTSGTIDLVESGEMNLASPLLYNSLALDGSLGHLSESVVEALPMQKDLMGSNMLLSAVQSKDLDRVRCLLDDGADFRMMFNDQPLFSFIVRDFVMPASELASSDLIPAEIIQAFLHRGATLTDSDLSGELFWEACIRGKFRIADILLQLGTKLEIPVVLVSVDLALMNACSAGAVSVVKAIVTACEKLSLNILRRQPHAFEEACRSGNGELVKFVLQQNVLTIPSRCEVVRESLIEFERYMNRDKVHWFDFDHEHQALEYWQKAVRQTWSPVELGTLVLSFLDSVSSTVISANASYAARHRAPLSSGSTTFSELIDALLDIEISINWDGVITEFTDIRQRWRDTLDNAKWHSLDLPSFVGADSTLPDEDKVLLSSLHFPDRNKVEDALAIASHTGQAEALAILLRLLGFFSISGFELSTKLETLLNNAATNGSVDAFKILLDYSQLKSPNTNFFRNTTSPLRYALAAGNVELVQFILERDRDALEYPCGLADRPYVLACRNSVELVQLVTQYECEVVPEGLLYAVRNNRPQVVKFLLDSQADVNLCVEFEDSGNQTPLALCLQLHGNNEELLEVLLSRGALVCTPQVNCLENVCRSNNRAVLVRLLKHCELYQSLTQEYFFTALCLCCRLPDIDVSLIAELIQAGADPNYVFPGLQTTPLLDAINTGKPAIVQELLSANALVYDGNSSEPLMLATFTSQPNAAIIKMIADAGTDLIPTSLLTIALQSLIESKKLGAKRSAEAAWYLIEKGASIEPLKGHASLRDEIIEFCKAKLGVRYNIPAYYRKNPDKTLLYLSELARDRKVSKRVRLVFIGKEAAGKTTFIQNMIGKRQWQGDGHKIEEKDTDTGEKRKRTAATDGIDIHSWKPPNSDIVLSIWDFAGQELYYSTHQFFLSKNAVFCLVFDVSKALSHYQTVYLVGTHADGMSEQQLNDVSKVLRNMVMDWKSSFEVRLNFIEEPVNHLFFWPVAKAVGVDRLRDHLVAQIGRTKFDSVPGSYLQLLSHVAALRPQREVPVMAWRDFEQEAGAAVGLSGESLRDAARTLHSWGELLYFDRDAHLAQRVILEPRWLIDVFKSVVSFKYIKNDTIARSDLVRRWKEQQWGSHTEFLLELLTNTFGVLLEHHGDDESASRSSTSPAAALSSSSSSAQSIDKRYLLLLDNHRNTQRLQRTAAFWSTGSTSAGAAETEQELFRYYRFPCVPAGMFNRLLASLMQSTSANEVPDVSRRLRFWQGVALVYEYPLTPDSSQLMLELVPMPDRSVGRTLRVFARGKRRKLLLKSLHMNLQSQCVQLYERLWAKVEANIKLGFALVSSRPDATRRRVEAVWDRHAIIKDYLNGRATLETEVLTCEVADLLPEIVVNQQLSSSSSPLTDSAALMTAIMGDNLEVPNRSYADLGEEIVLETKLGGGMFGAVYRGRWNDQAVAIKLIYNPEELGAFIREVELLKTLQHPNIVEFYHVCLLPYPTLVMELVGGGDLHRVLLRKQLTSWPIVTRIALDVARGMAYMHQQQPPVIHRDLRPPNVLIKELNLEAPVIAQVGDVGISQVADTASAMISGKAKDVHDFVLKVLKPLHGAITDEPCPTWLSSIFASIERDLSWIGFSAICTRLEKANRLLSDTNETPSDDSLSLSTVDADQCAHELLYELSINKDSAGLTRELSLLRDGAILPESARSALVDAVLESLDKPDAVELVEAVLAAGVIDVDIVRQSDGRTMLLEAVARQVPRELLEALLKAGANMAHQDLAGRSVCHLAAEHNNYEQVELFDSYGADLSLVDNKGNTPLHIAAGFGRVSVLQAILRGAGTLRENLAWENEDGFTPIEYAAKGRHRECVDQLIARGSPAPSHCEAMSIMFIYETAVQVMERTYKDANEYLLDGVQRFLSSINGVVLAHLQESVLECNNKARTFFSRAQLFRGPRRRIAVSLSGFSLFPHKLAFPEAVKLSTETEGSLIRITNTSKVPLDFFISDYIGSDVQISISWDNSLTNVPPGASRTIRATAVVHAPLQLNLSLLLMVLGKPDKTNEERLNVFLKAELNASPKATAAADLS